jgi:hypothetical protein
MSYQRDYGEYQGQALGHFDHDLAQRVQETVQFDLFETQRQIYNAREAQHEG